MQAGSTSSWRAARSNSSTSRGGAWADDSEVAKFVAELPSATTDVPLSQMLAAVQQIDGPALPLAFTASPTAAGAVTPLSPAAEPQKRQTDVMRDIAGLRQDTRAPDTAARAAPTAGAAPRARAEKRAHAGRRAREVPRAWRVSSHSLRCAASTSNFGPLLPAGGAR